MQKFFIHDGQGRVIGGVRAADPARAVQVFALRYGFKVHQLQAHAVGPQSQQPGQVPPWAR